MDRKFKFEIKWLNVFVLFFIHISALYGFYLAINETFYISILFSNYYGMISTLGVQCGAHRLWCHRTFKAKLSVQILLIIMESMAGQTPIYEWCRDHRMHHKNSETDADPHNSNRGFFFAHCGWLMCKKHPDVRIKAKSIDMNDLDSDYLVKFQRKHYYIFLFIFWFSIPILIPYYFWNETLTSSIFVCVFLRYALSLNLTWTVNSAAHFWGTKPYDKNINPVECSIRLLQYGEGYHNYHHVFPSDYSASEFGSLSIFNPATMLIDIFWYFGLAYDLKKTPLNSIENKKLKDGHIMSSENSITYEIIAGILSLHFPSLMILSIYSLKPYIKKYFNIF